MSLDHSNLRPTPTDGYPTPTSMLQTATENILQSSLSSQPPTLQRNLHLQFLLRNLVQGFPSRYVSQDASQPWLIFWTLQGFSVLGVGLDPQTKQRYVIVYLRIASMCSLSSQGHQDSTSTSTPGRRLLRWTRSIRPSTSYICVCLCPSNSGTTG